MKSKKLISLLVPLLVLAIPTYLVYTLLIWISTGDPTQVKQSTLYYLVFFFLLMALLGILQRLGIKALDLIAEDVIDRFQSLFLGYEKKYYEYLTYRFRDFEMSGLTIPGVLNLGLKDVYVNLLLSPLDSSSEMNGREIWSYLDSKTVNGDGQKIVLLGSPGSGKTTLLRHSTLVLAGTHNLSLGNLKKNPLPILLTLREHASAIMDAPNLSLIHTIRATLVGKVDDPPDGWIENRLNRGQCVLMMDGLDEIADPNTRSMVVEWVKRQMAAYRLNHFVIASRPYGYENNPLTGVTVLEIQPFTIDQIRSFIHNWYLANESAKSQKNDTGVKMKAKESADDLVERLKERPALTKLAENPLLVAMIATVHSFKVPLPGRRVELYKDITKAFVRPRKGVVGLNNQLREEQKLVVLRLLAWHMMMNELRVISAEDALQVIKDRLLSLAGPHLDGSDFLSDIEEQSGLLLEVGGDRYSFAHLTFQEFLASAHVISSKIAELENILISNIGDSWWAETIRLYAAQTNATKLIEACMEDGNINLAYDCVREAQEIDPDIRQEFERFLDQNIESDKSEHRAVAGKAKLDSRLRWMSRLSKNLSIDTGLVSNIEFQYFLDEMNKRGDCYCPEHWGDNRFAKGTGKEPVVGIRPRDAIRFCKWLTERELWHAGYRIPTLAEANSNDVDEHVYPHLAYWVTENNTIKLKSSNPLLQFIVSQENVIEQIKADLVQLQDLQDALKGSSIPPRPIEKLIHNYPPLGGGIGGIRKGSVRPVGDSAIEPNLSRKDRIKYLLRRFVQYSNDLGLNISEIIEDASLILLKDRESHLAASSWLSPIKPQYYINHFDIESEIKVFKEFLLVKSANDLVSQRAKLFSENVISSLSIIQNRKGLNENVILDSICGKQIAKFLGWYARICIVALVCTEKSHHKSSQISVVITEPQLFKTCEDMLVNLVFSELRLDKKQQAIEGLRLVKEDD